MKVTRKNMGEYLIAVLKLAGEVDAISDEDRGILFKAMEIIATFPSDIPLIAKTCSRCREMLPATSKHFDYLDKASDGFAYRCKKCRRKYMNNYGRMARKRDRYPAGDQAAIEEFARAQGGVVEKFPKKLSKTTAMMYAMESLAPKPEGVPADES